MLLGRVSGVSWSALLGWCCSGCSGRPLDMWSWSRQSCWGWMMQWLAPSTSQQFAVVLSSRLVQLACSFRPHSKNNSREILISNKKTMRLLSAFSFGLFGFRYHRLPLGSSATTETRKSPHRHMKILAKFPCPWPWYYRRPFLTCCCRYLSKPCMQCGFRKPLPGVAQSCFATRPR